LPATEQGFFTKAKYAGQYPLSKLVTYTNREGRLEATFHLPAELMKGTGDGTPLLLALEGSPHVWTLHRRKSGTLDEAMSLVTLTCYAPDEVSWPLNRFALSSDGFSVSVTGAQMFGRPGAYQNVTLSQTGRSVNVTSRLESERFLPRRVEVADLASLPSRAPNVLELYLMPVLRRLGPARPASDIYRAFDQIPADDAASARVVTLLGKLESGNPGVREAAVRALREIGRPAILACLRLDPGALTPEQANRLSAFYAGEGWVHVEDIDAARRDVPFLSACLEDEDPRVRLAAANTLATLRAVGR
jgi:hypothetical protein